MKIKQTATWLGLAGAVVLAAGCATSETNSGAAPKYRPNPATAACFYARQVSDFTVLDRRNLIVYSPNKRSPYHVELTSSSGNLRFANAIGFESRDPRICG